MLKPEKHKLEQQRLEEIHDFGILDTPPEAAFDNLTFLATKICNVPVALVSIVDADRQWFKSKVGMEVNETHRDLSFCGHAIHSERIFEVKDALADPNFSDNPLVMSGPKIRFYAGAPLVTRQGNAIGTLCVIDHKPGQLEEWQHRALSSLANQVVNLLELRRLTRVAIERVQQIEKNERLLDESQRIAKLGSWEYDIATDLQLWSPEQYRIFEVDPSDHMTNLFQVFQERVHPDDVSQMFRLLGRAKDFGEDFVFDHRIKLDGGERIKYVRSTCRVTRDGTGRPVSIVGICQDRTAEAEMERIVASEREKSLQSAKLASVGELSAGIAHEVNNPLAIISGTLLGLSKYFDDKPKLEARIATVTKAVDRIAKIISGLRKFSRTSIKQNMKPHPLPLLIDEAIVLISPKARQHGVSLEQSIKGQYNILCNDIEIEQVLVNLVSNAIDAIKDLKVKWIRLELAETGDAIVLRVIDSGFGIDPQIKEKIFQPFFTTKRVGEGTGLGLAIVKGILDEHHATIELVEEEVHTCFKLSFKKVNA